MAQSQQACNTHSRKRRVSYGTPIWVKPKSEVSSSFTLMFLTTVLEKAIKDKFSYDDKCVWCKAKLLSVTLPCTCEGEPDWDYMESYMSQVMQDADAALDNLVSAN